MKKSDPRQDFLKMLQKYLDGKSTPEEKQFVEAYYDSLEQKRDVLDQYSENQRQALQDEMESYLLAHVEEDIDVIPIWRKMWFRAAAASVLLIFALGAGYYFKIENRQQVAAKMVPKDFTPGGDKAILTLSDGSSIVLDSTLKGNIANGDMAQINKTEEGQLVYGMSGKDEVSQLVKLNTVTTPAGGQYRIVLADGSKVWLNAESSLQFPTNFTGKERKVKITGECYFEVAKDKSRPFVVNVADKQDIVVMGTHFNINSYHDEADIKTTLLEGSVRVQKANISNTERRSDGVTLTPGEQSAMTGNGRFRVKNVDTQEVVAWKNGLFQFQKTSLEMVMRQVARWYNVEVAYEQHIPARTFSGKIHRNTNASQILEILRFAGVNFRIEGSEKEGMTGRIVVTP